MSGTAVRRRVAAAVATAAMVAGCAANDQAPSAAEQVPHLSVVLDRVDAALAEHHFAAARRYLRALKTDVVEARDAGDLSEADATRVLGAVARLLGLLPATTPSPSATPELESPSPTRSARPSSSKKPTPKHEASSSTPTPTPSSAPTSPSATTTPTSATPTGAPTREGSAIPSPTATP